MRKTRCLIDNWSIENAAILLYGGASEAWQRVKNGGIYIIPDYEIKKSDLINLFQDIDLYLGAFSNLVSALILFDEVVYLKNGYEIGWMMDRGFSEQFTKIAVGEKPPSAKNYDSKQNNNLSRDHKGTGYYCHTSKLLDAYPILSPARSDVIMKKANHNSLNYADFAFDLLNFLDINLKKCIESSDSKLLRFRFDPEFSLPALTHFVLSESSSRKDILNVALQIRDTAEVRDFRKVLSETALDYENALKYIKILKEAKSTIDNVFFSNSSQDTVGSVGINLLFLNISFNIKKRLFKQERYALFLKDIARRRLENNMAADHIMRLFV